MSFLLGLGAFGIACLLILKAALWVCRKLWDVD